MRLAVFSDIHGNSAALDAVLADIHRQGGVDAYWVLGDLAGIGPDPVGVIERLKRLPNAAYVRGNADRSLTFAPAPLTPQELAENIQYLERYIELMQNRAWTTGALEGTGGYEMLSALPLEQRLVLPDGTRVLGVHAAPGMDDGEGIHPRMSEERLREVLEPAEADLVFVGHTHWPMDVTVDSTRVINPGSVSNSFLPDLRAKYSVITADEKGHSIEHRRVEYDLAAVMEATMRTHNPAKSFILRALSGENRPVWSINITAAEVKTLGLPEEWGQENA